VSRAISRKGGRERERKERKRVKEGGGRANSGVRLGERQKEGSSATIRKSLERENLEGEWSGGQFCQRNRGGRGNFMPL